MDGGQVFGSECYISGQRLDHPTTDPEARLYRKGKGNEAELS